MIPFVKLFNIISFIFLVSFFSISTDGLANPANQELPDYSDNSVEDLKKKSAAGDAHATFTLGYNLLFDDGNIPRSGEVDLETAMRLLNSAHKADHPHANTILAFIYNGNFGYPYSPDKHEQVSREAAERGSTISKLNYALWHMDSEDEAVAQRAFSYLNDTVEDPLLLGEAYPTLVEILYRGKPHIEADWVKARKTALDCTQHVSESGYCHYILGRDFLQGWGGEIDKVKSAHHYLRSAELGDARAMWKTGMNYLNGAGGMDVDEVTAFTWVKRAAELEHTNGLISLGVMYAIGQGTDINYEKSFAAYEQAAHQGSFHAVRGMSGMYCTGEGVEVDRAMCKAGLILAVEQNDQEAPKLLSEHFNIISEPDRARAKSETRSERKTWIARYNLPEIEN